MRTLSAATALALSASFMPAQAASIFFGEDLNPGQTVPAGGNAETARNAFLSTLVGVGTEDFEGFVGSPFPYVTPADGLVLNFPGSSGAISATLSDPLDGDAGISNTPELGRFATSGENYLNEVTNGFALDFSSPVAAFGFYGTDIGDFDGQITLSFTNGEVQDFVVPNTVNGPNGSLLFWGIIADDPSETFVSAVFGNTAAGSDFFGFDDLTIGDIEQVRFVPLPAPALLLMAGLAGLGLLRRRDTV